MKKKIFTSALITLLSVVVIILSVLQLTNVWPDAINVIEPLIGVVLLLQGYLFWEKDRKVALISISASAIVFVFAIYILFFSR